MVIQHFNRLLTSHGYSRNQRRGVFLVILVIVVLISVSALSWDESSFNSSTTAVIVLGGGLTSDGLVPEHTQLRLNEAFQLFKDDSDGKTVIITLSGGTPHKPNPLDKNGFPIWESSAAAMKLVQMGVPSDKVFEENFSLDTLGNAYFLRTVHIDPARYSKLIVVTNEWHMDRTKALFNYVFSLPATHSWFSKILKPKYNIEYIPVASGIADDSLLKVRREKEQASLQSFEKTVKHEFSSLLTLHDWIFTQHKAYATSRHNNRVDSIDPELLKTY